MPYVTARTDISAATPGLTEEIEAVLGDVFGQDDADVGDSTAVTNRAPSVADEEPAKPKQEAPGGAARTDAGTRAGQPRLQLQPGQGSSRGSTPPPNLVRIPEHSGACTVARERATAAPRAGPARKDIAPPRQIDPRLLAAALPEEQRAVATTSPMRRRRCPRSRSSTTRPTRRCRPGCR